MMAHMQHWMGAVFSDPALTETESKEGFLTKAVARQNSSEGM